MVTDQQLRAQAMEYALNLPDNTKTLAQYGSMSGGIQYAYKTPAQLLDDAQHIFEWIKGRDKKPRKR